MTRVGLVPIGYADGWRRGLGGVGAVLVRGKRCPMVGRVCMDQLMVSIGRGTAYNGDEVTLIGRDGAQEVRVEAVANWAGTIPHEILACINTRVPRVYVDGGRA